MPEELKSKDAQPKPPAKAQASKQKRQSRKKMIVGGAIAAALVVFGGGGALAYNLWYQHPDKVVHDAVINAMQARTIQGDAELSIKAEEADLKLTMDSKATRADGLINVKADLAMKPEAAAAELNVNIAGSAVYKENVIYVKLEGVREAVDAAIESYPIAQIFNPSAFDEIIEKIDNQWVSIAPSDYETQSQRLAESQKCFTEAFEKLADNRDATRELTNLYKEHKILEVKEELGAKDGNLGYVVNASKDSAQAFFEGLNDTTFGKELKKCDENIDFSQESEQTASNGPEFTNELWVTRFGHEIAEFSSKASEDGNEFSAVVRPEFNRSVTVDAPEGAISLEEIMDDIDAIMRSYQPAVPVAPTSDEMQF